MFKLTYGSVFKDARVHLVADELRRIRWLTRFTQSVRMRRDLARNRVVDRQPVSVDDDWRDVIAPTQFGDDSNEYVLDPLQLVKIQAMTCRANKSRAADNNAHSCGARSGRHGCASMPQSASNKTYK